MPYENKQYYCEKCHKTMDGTQFYTSNNLEKYSNDGKLPQCKKCITMHVNNWDPKTYLWILQECDVPYIPEQWDALMSKFAKDPKKTTGMTIIGRYLSKMKLAQFHDYRWKDSQFLQDLKAKQIKESMESQGYDIQEITKAIQGNTYEMPTEELKEPLPPPPPPLASLVGGDFSNTDSGNLNEDYFKDNLDFEVPDLGAELTDEDKRYLYLKWGKGYTPDEWVRLEQLFNEMMQSYDIQSAGHIDTLKLACKTSLKSNQLLDIGDVDGAQKMIKMYDSLMKSGKFTAAQNKEESGDFVDSVGELIEMCEKQGYIERYYIDTPNDKVDFTIKDMQKYTRTLIERETNLGNMIDQALKQNAKEDEQAKENVEDTIVDDVDMSIEDIEKSLEDIDIEDFSEFLDNETELDIDAFSDRED